MLKTVLAATLAVTALTLSAERTPAEAACGFWAFAGAFQNYNNAQRRQRQVGGSIWDLDSSDSPNAGKGFFVIAEGPGSRAQANRWKRQFRNNGARSAYVARRCLYAS